MPKRSIVSVVLAAVIVGLGCRFTGVYDLTHGDTISPFRIAPSRLAVPAGAVARFEVLRTEPLLDASFDWSISGLPPGADAAFSTGTGYPVDGVLLISTAGASLPGAFPLTVTLSTDEHTWSQTITLDLTPCEETVQTGPFAARTSVTHLAGGPSRLTYGTGSHVLVFCASATPRRLTVHVETVTSEHGDVWPGTESTLALYRLLDWPLPPEIVTIVTDNRDDRNVESVASGEDGVLTWDITPGAFFIFFPQYRVQGTQPGDGGLDAAISVMYRLEVEQVP